MSRQIKLDGPKAYSGAAVGTSFTSKLHAHALHCIALYEHEHMHGMMGLLGIRVFIYRDVRSRKKSCLYARRCGPAPVALCDWRTLAGALGTSSVLTGDAGAAWWRPYDRGARQLKAQRDFHTSPRLRLGKTIQHIANGWTSRGRARVRTGEHDS
jgi:hypothetical protein